MKDTAFENWLAGLFGQSEHEVERLLGDKNAVQFLIAWSLFESRCFSGFVRTEEIQDFSERLTDIENFDAPSISEYAHHFHARYKGDKTLYRNLMHKQKCKKLDAILNSSVQELTPTEIVFLSTFVVYRFRNNIFHGNKEVNSWLKFTEQITHCISILQQFVSHAEAIKCTLKSIEPV